MLFLLGSYGHLKVPAGFRKKSQQSELDTSMRLDTSICTPIMDCTCVPIITTTLLNLPSIDTQSAGGALDVWMVQPAFRSDLYPPECVPGILA